MPVPFYSSKWLCLSSLVSALFRWDMSPHYLVSSNRSILAMETTDLHPFTREYFQIDIWQERILNCRAEVRGNNFSSRWEEMGDSPLLRSRDKGDTHTTCNTVILQKGWYKKWRWHDTRTYMDNKERLHSYMHTWTWHASKHTIVTHAC